MFKLAVIVVSVLTVTNALGAESDISADNGKRISIIGGCHDCHSVGYAESGGMIDPASALKGNPVGYNGPWGTTYAQNLRLIASKMTEDEWVTYLSTLEAAPPMPWFNVHALTEAEARSLYQYIGSLGEPGDPAPEAIPPGQAPKTPYVVMAPPTMPAS